MSQITGKIPGQGLDELILPRLGFWRSNIMQGPAFGVDVSLLDIGNGQGLALTSDPLSLIPSLGLPESAWLSVHLMANDMATTGFAPQYAQMVLNLPASFSSHDLKVYWEYIHQYCAAIGVAITGGHTGNVEGQNSTIAGGGTMLLTAPLHRILLSNHARAGDLLVVSKECALLSTAILAMSFPQTVQNKLGKEVYDIACGNFYKTSSLQDALAAAATGAVNAMHDVTEGGVLGAVYEMATAAGLGVRIQNELLPIHEAPLAVASLFGLNPRYCIGAGAVIMAVPPAGINAVMGALASREIQATVIGEFTDEHKQCVLQYQDKQTAMPYHEKDAYWTAFFNAIKNKWN